MDFFETRERYRRRELRGYTMVLLRLSFFIVVLWIGWLWGKAETGSLRAESERALYENGQRIQELSGEVQDLKRELGDTRARNKVADLAQDQDAALNNLVTNKIASGVKPAQILQSIQNLGRHSNCREVESVNIAVATKLYDGPESKVALLGGGLNIHISGEASREASRETPLFNPDQAINIRLAYLGGQKSTNGVLPLQAVIPAEEWVLRLDFTIAEINGYVAGKVYRCTQS